jgi:hypothetical protein
LTYILRTMWRPIHRIPIIPALFLFLAVALSAAGKSDAVVIQRLAVIRESGEYRRIHEEWLGVYTPSEYDAGRILHIVFLALLPVLLILTVVVLWNRSLRAQVVRKTVELRRSMQRTQWLNEVATSYLLRKDTMQLIEETLETLNAHFSPAATV